MHRIEAYTRLAIIFIIIINVEEALNKIEKNKIDLICSDMMWVIQMVWNYLNI